MNPTTLLTGLGAAITAEPTLGGAGAAGPGPDQGTGDLFLALVNGLLKGGSTGGGDPALAAPAGTTDPTDGTDRPADSDVGTTDPSSGTATTDQPAAAADQAGTVPAPMLALPMTPLVVQAAVTAVAIETNDPGETADRTETPAALAPSNAAAAPEPRTAAAPSAPTAPAAPAVTAGSPDAETPAAEASSPDAGTSSPTDPTTSTSATVAPSQSAPRPAAGVDPGPAPVPTAVTTVAPTVAPTAVAASTTSADLPRVTDQVFPEVLRASTNADNGTSRVTIKLNPESLGEVRVVLTQRHGGLEVSLAGGADARRALTEGAPELRRLLESVGRSDSRILIRDLPSGATPPVPAAGGGPSTRTDVSTDLAGGAWSGAGRPGGEPAPDRENPRPHPGSSTATDGIPSATTTGSRPTTPAGRGRAGLDLSM